MSNEEAVFEKQHSGLIFSSSPHEHLKEAIQTVEQENCLNLKRMSSWRWSTGGCGHDSSDDPVSPEKSLCILVRQKNNTGHKGWIILLLADVKEESVTDNKPLQRRVYYGTYCGILIIPDRRPPAQRRMSAFRNNWQDFCFWVCLQGSCLAEWGPGPACVQQTQRGLKDMFEADHNMN